MINSIKLIYLITRENVGHVLLTEGHMLCSAQRGYVIINTICNIL